MDVVQRPFFRASVHDFTVHFKFVCEFYYFVLSYFHDIVDLCKVYIFKSKRRNLPS